MMPTPITPALRTKVYNLDNDRCAYCRTPEYLTSVTFEVDHIIPISAGGETTVANLCLACPSCNRYKAARQTAPDPDTGQETPLYHPRQQAWTTHFTWNDDATHIIGLTATGRATVSTLRMNRPALVHLRQLWRKMGFAIDEV